MDLDSRQQRIIFEAIATTIIAHATELSELDRAIGDGDHGVNMTRGFKAVQEHIEELASLPLDKALSDVGKRLVMTVGGASGPLYGTLFLALGDQLKGPEPLTRERLFSAFDAAIAKVKARGKSDVGQKTMLDVLVPVLEELHANPGDLLRRLRVRADAAAAATTPMRAQRGRAAFLGERSIGHMDPGARSSQLMIVAVCDTLEGASDHHHAE
jgi:dihydroxyacetone kinase-like protein